MGGGPREGPPDWATPVNKTFTNLSQHCRIKSETWSEEDLILLSLLGVYQLEALRLNHDWHEEYRCCGENHPSCRLGKAEVEI